MSAVTAEGLKNTGVTGLTNLQTTIPSLSIHNVNGNLAFHLRGVGSLANGPGFENPIALYVDGVYIAARSADAATQEPGK